MPSPMNGSEPKTGTDGADGGVSRTIGADDDALAVRGKDRLHGKCRKRGVNPVTRVAGRYLNGQSVITELIPLSTRSLYTL